MWYDDSFLDCLLFVLILFDFSFNFNSKGYLNTAEALQNEAGIAASKVSQSTTLLLVLWVLVVDNH